ncbi:MAG TPA: alpha/beta fold hydrolase [Microvirga sp.]|jgi:pimeloyl-ACP methyl ester carboxylesterase|nr:alpha/beta fold hydrolase [Microvirga sp.]
MTDPEPLILVPGLCLTGGLFAPQIEALGGDRPILVADHRQDDSIAAIARRLLAGAPERFALAGLSMGGYVALEVLRQAPDRVSRLALLDTSARPDTPEARGDREALIAKAASGRFDEVKSALLPRFIQSSRLDDRSLVDRILAMMDETGPDAFIRQQRAIMGRTDARDRLPGIEIPTLILVGADDRLTPPDLSREMADRVEWSSLVVVPDCGHLPTLEQPEAVIKALQAWLSDPERRM